MSWGEIKKALNSTLGTPQFKPLNVIIREAIAEGVRFQELEVVSNGEYTPDTEHDGFSKVIVNVPIPSYETYDGEVAMSGIITFTYVTVNYADETSVYTFQAEDGMTWEQFISSSYNNSNGCRFYYIDGEICFGLSESDYEIYVTVDGLTVVELTDTIIDGNQYQYMP